MKISLSKFVAFNGTIAALYVLLTVVFLPISFGIAQLRIAECFAILPAVFPFSVVGVTVGCLIANLFSPFGAPDIILGTLTTFVAALLTRKFNKIGWAILPPILLNSLFLPLVWLVFANETTYWFNVLSMLIGQTVVIVALGIPLFFTLKKLTKKHFQH